MPTEILILDFNREEELATLLKSLKEKALFDKKVVVLNNGGERYADKYKEEGLIDKVIHNPINVGCGMGTIQLFAQCESEFAFYIQCDHLLACEITENEIQEWKSLIDSYGYFYVDLSGNQGQGNYSERGQFFKKENYFKAPLECGGPGPFDHFKWTEECMQDYIKNNDLKFHSEYCLGTHNGQIFRSPIFLDNGKWSVRENPDGGQFKHRTDTKVVQILKRPKEKFSFPPFSDEQWELAINGNYPKEGLVPDGWKDNVFKCWAD